MEADMRRSFAALTAAALLSLLSACSDSRDEAPADPPAGPRPGTWLSGDLHLHSDHSDDAADNPMAELVNVAEERGMGFFTVTDHDNHVEGRLTTWDDPAFRSGKMVLLYGVEYTTARGHANIFGTKPFDHPRLYALRDRSDVGAGRAIAAEAHAQGLHLSVNHPVNGDPWEFGFDMPFDSMEVWNALYAFPTDNSGAIRLWDELIGGGRRITGRGGSDCHHQTGIESLGLNVGNPTTWVYAEAPTAAAVLAALKAGHVAVGYAPTAERLRLTADADHDGGYEALMGDSLPAAGRPVAFRLEIDGARPLAVYNVTVLKNGQPFLERRLFGEQALDFEDRPAAGQRSWYRVEVRGSTPEAPAAAVLVGFYGGFVGLTNPIYFGFE
ncbi:histidinol-phosphatase [Solimonas fluminis]|uniref:Histidinol-phosphatase n=1 Tax=Solimonas fluminis TaxID=2086571 RepID=A0A2S5TDY1_9GAMM|nr:CehA/McbA family metallohydrolase [Solimonas fluminis]PPE73058.1 histidinol-phosphatase [Solimonas fluminis]